MATAGDRYNVRTGNIWSYASRGDMSGLKAAVARGVEINIKNTVGWTPCHSAAAGGRLKALRYLAKLDANIEEVDNGGCTPAHQAAKNGQVQALRLLQDLGADITVVRLSHAKGKATRDFLIEAYKKADKSEIVKQEELVGYARKQVKSNAFFGPRRTPISTKIKKKIIKDNRLKKKQTRLSKEEDRLQEFSEDDRHQTVEPNYVETVRRIKRDKKRRQKAKLGRCNHKTCNDEVEAHEGDALSCSSGSEIEEMFSNGFASLMEDSDTESGTDGE